MDNKLCSRCGTENLPDYRFCKKCGNPLEVIGQADGYAQPMYRPQPIYTNTIDGVATADVAAFVGKAAPKYIPKFCQMELNRSTVSFNWLFAVMTIVVTPFFAPCWFIHKKMYKIGFLPESRIVHPRDRRRCTKNAYHRRQTSACIDPRGLHKTRYRYRGHW